MERDYSPREVIAIVRRRRWAVMAAVFVGLGVASAASLALPKAYKCSTRIEVSQNRNMPGSEYSAKVDAVQQQILSSVTMERVVDEMCLAPGGDADRRAAVAKGLLAATRVEKDEPVEGVYYIKVEHTAASPEMAFRTLDSLVSGFKEDLYNRPRELQQKEVEGCRKNVEAAEERVNQAQEALGEYEKSNSDLLRPIEDDLSAVQKEIESIEQKDLVLWKEKLQQAEDGLAVEPQYTKQEQRKVDSVRMSAIESDLNRAKSKLNELTITKKYTDEHPEVQAARANIAELEKQKAELEKNAPVEVRLIPNELYVQYTRDRGEAKSQLMVAEMRVAGLRKNEKSLQELKKQAPPVRAQRERLASDLKGAGQVLDDRKKELARAEDKAKVIDDERQLNFKVVDEPLPPRNPAGPSAAIFALGGLVLGAGAGLGLAWILDVQDRSFREVDAVAEFLGLPSLGAIHTIETPAEAAVVRRATVRRAAVVAALAIAALGLTSAAMWSGMRSSPPPGAAGGDR